MVAAAAGLLALVGTGGGAVLAAPEPARIAVVPVDLGTSETLIDVSFPDAQHGWAVGMNGTILATSDSGVTWSRQRSGVEVSAEEVAARVVGERAARQEVNLSGVSFVNARVGWAVGTDAVLMTSDGGGHWSALKLPPIDSIPGDGPGRVGQPTRAVKWELQAVRFTDEKRGVVVGAGGTILTTEDGGLTWTWRGDRRFGSLRAVSFTDAANGHAVGLTGAGASQQSVAVATTDGGATWQARDAAGLGSDVSTVGFTAVATPGGARAYVAGGEGRIFVTVDGGRRWSVQRQDTTESFEGMAFWGIERGVVVGLTEFSGSYRASFVVTDDGGETWAGRLVDGASLWGVAFASPETAYAVGCRAFVERGEVKAVQADGSFSDVLQPCRTSLMVRVSFAPSRATGGDGGGGGIPWPAVGGGAAVALVAVVVVAGRRRRGVQR